MPKPQLIAVVDDEPDILELLTLHLGRAGYRVEAFADASRFLRFLEKNRPDLVILDLMLPDIDGLEICKHMRRTESLAAVPIIMLTARGGETDKVLGLELGADDYISKPFSVQELAARVQAVLRRGTVRESDKIIKLSESLIMDLDRHEVRLEGRPVDLTATEFRILELLGTRRGRVFSRNQILDYLWGHEKAVVDRTVDVHIRNLREKLGPAAALIKNIRSVGYKVEE